MQPGGHSRSETQRTDHPSWRERRYRDLLLSLVHEIWVADAQAMRSQVVDGRDSDAAIAGQQTHLAQSLEFVHPEDRPQLLQAIQHSLTKGEPLKMQSRVLWRDGHWKHCFFHGIPIRDDAGQILEWAGVTYDVSDRVAAEEKIQKHTLRLQTALSASRMGLWEVDLLTGRIEWSPEVFEILHQDTFDGSLLHWLSLIHREDRDMFRTAFDDLFSTDSRLMVDCRLHCVSGAEKWIRHRGRMEHNRDGIAVRIIGTVQDISEEVRNHQEIKQRGEWLGIAIEAAGLSAWTYEADRQVIRVFSHRAAWDWLFTNNETTLEKARRVTHPDDMAIAAELLQRKEDSQDQMVQADFRVRRPDGEYRWTTNRGRWTNPSTLYAITMDTTEQHKARVALSESQRRLQDAQALSHIGSLFWDSSSNRTSWSEEMYCIFDTPLDTPIPRLETYLDFVHPEDRCKANETLRQAIAESKHFEQEFRIFTRDEKVRWVFVLGRVLRDANGFCLGVEATCQDITQRVETESRLAVQQSELLHISRLSTLGLMSAALAHEINQPLSAIANFTSACSMILSRPGDIDLSELRKHLDEINAQSLRAGKIVRRLREFSTKSTTKRSDCNINGVLRDAVQFVSIELRSRGCDVFCSYLEPSPMIRGDNVQLQQVIVNLLTNAADALADIPLNHRIIRVGTEVEEKVCRIYVEDCGLGIPREIHDRLFQPFTSTKPTGMGLGLSICRMIVEDHEGRIDVSSVPSGGTRFTIQLNVWNQVN